MMSHQSHQSYIGVTGFQHIDQIETAIRTFQRSRPISHILMCGVLAEPPLIKGGVPASERAVSHIEDIINLFSTAADVFPVLHYKIFECNDLFADDLLHILRALNESGLPLAVQLNGTPAVHETKTLRAAFPDLTLLYQIRPELLALGPAGVVDEIKSHGSDMFQYALIDPSCGTGKDFRIDDVLPVYHAVQKYLPALGVGFAGGFDGENAQQRIRDIRSSLGSDAFSVDAEGRLFTEATLDSKKVDAYLEAAAEGFSE